MENQNNKWCNCFICQMYLPEAGMASDILMPKMKICPQCVETYNPFNEDRDEPAEEEESTPLFCCNECAILKPESDYLIEFIGDGSDVCAECDEEHSANHFICVKCDQEKSYDEYDEEKDDFICNHCRDTDEEKFNKNWIPATRDSMNKK